MDINQSTVFILGAGASASAGAPVMRDFLDRAETLYLNHRVEGDTEAFKAVFEALIQLRAAAYKANLDTINLETVFNAFEMGQLLGRLGNIDTKALEQLRANFQRLIVRTLSESIDRVPDGLIKFAEFLQRAIHLHAKWSVITFNYDLLVEVALLRAGCHVRYTPNQILKPEIGNTTEVWLHKLHGSMNWVRDGDGFSAIPHAVAVTQQGTKITVPSPTGRNEPPVPLIVPPSMRKADLYSSVKTVWTGAADALGTAQNIIVGGFSLPPTDEFFKYLFALGAIGDSRILRFWIVDKYADESLVRRFRALLGQETRKRLQVFKMDFQQFLGKLSSASTPERFSWSQVEWAVNDTLDNVESTKVIRKRRL